MAHPNEELVRRGYEAFSNGDMDTLASLMAEDVVHQVPGTHPLSGEYKGQDAVFGYYAALGEESGGTFAVELEEARAEGDDKVVSRHRHTAKRDGKTLDDRDTLTFTISNGKMTEIIEQPGDQAATDDFWA